jgi:hypothetical protein
LEIQERRNPFDQELWAKRYEDVDSALALATFASVNAVNTPPPRGASWTESTPRCLRFSTSIS